MSLKVRSASPIRVPLDQSGAASAARWIASSGLRPPRARVSRVRRVANTNASAGRAARDRRGQQVQVGARVGLHRARDVADQDQLARAGAPAPPRQGHRVAAGAEAVAKGAAQVELLAAARAAPAPGEPAREPRAPARSSSAGSAPARRAPSSSKRFSPKPLLLAGHRQRHLDLALPVLVGAGLGGGAAHAAGALVLAALRAPSAHADRAGARSDCEPLSVGVYGSPRSSSGSSAGSKTAAKTRSNVGSCACEETNTARAVQ